MRKPVHHRERPNATEATDASAPAAAAAPPTPSFERDIRPMFVPFAAAMMWRFDLTDYDAVMANAQTILGRINGGGMPPPPFPPLTAEQIQTFQSWMNAGCNR